MVLRPRKFPESQGPAAPEDLAVRFSYHPPQYSQIDRFAAIRVAGRDLADAVNEVCPKSREAALALTKVEEAVMWANAAIARAEEVLFDE